MPRKIKDTKAVKVEVSIEIASTKDLTEEDVQKVIDEMDYSFDYDEDGIFINDTNIADVDTDPYGDEDED